MSSSLWNALVLFALGYGVLALLAARADRREQGDTAERFRDLAFAVALAAAAYTAVLVVLAALDAPSRFYDAVLITIIIFLFFLALLLVMFGIGAVVSRFTRSPR